MNNNKYRKRRNANNKNVPRAPDYLPLIDGNVSQYIVGYCTRKGGFMTNGLVNVHRCRERHCNKFEEYKRGIKMSSVVTRVDVRKYENGNVKGFANVCINEDFVITGVSIVEGKNGLFVSFPNKKGKDNNYHDICYPVSAELRNHITENVTMVYEKMIKAKRNELSLEYSNK